MVTRESDDVFCLSGTPKQVFVYKNKAIPTPTPASATATLLLKVVVVDDPDIPVIEGAFTPSVGEVGAVVEAVPAMRLSVPPDGREVAVLEPLFVPEAAPPVTAAAVDEAAPVPSSTLIAGIL